ncbi:gamma-glutamyl hydrolase 2 isoform X3 [Amborella trichopoda]|uniref:gamma-glutamyl hydrolase 2 isoform X3 n=1 Tax=Amborella trichopoda TaxID=13333 RepID=UPI0005D2EC0E|nr:gamma-glutamyl hydrolase 2 isoform X3 [Amborella trichopoda]|eukprot:XP_011620471.1 gamma-glutamyl hydrolase 2 isoform X3 [Amborella trichopoda]
MADASNIRRPLLPRDQQTKIMQHDNGCLRLSSSDLWNFLCVNLLFSSSNRTAINANAQCLLLPSDSDGEIPAEVSAKSAEIQSCPAPDPALYYQPVIGILTHPGDGASGRLMNGSHVSYIAASYVKFCEAAGARVIPLIYNERREVLLEKLNLVNGMLLTGGWCKRGLYYDTVEMIFKHVLERNDAGDHFPLVAICLNFELISIIVSQDRSIFERYSALDLPSTLQFKQNIELNNTVFRRFSSELLKKVSTECLIMQSHRKNAFEWGLPNIPHSEDAVQVTQHVANFFISEARKSSNRPPTTRVLDNLIYNHSPTYCGKAGKGYDEVYLFP